VTANEPCNEIQKGESDNADAQMSGNMKTDVTEEKENQSR
jgi:hypothetical protein